VARRRLHRLWPLVPELTEPFGNLSLWCGRVSGLPFSYCPPLTGVPAKPSYHFLHPLVHSGPCSLVVLLLQSPPSPTFLPPIRIRYPMMVNEHYGSSMFIVSSPPFPALTYLLQSFLSSCDRPAVTPSYVRHFSFSTLFPPNIYGHLLTSSPPEGRSYSTPSSLRDVFWPLSHPGCSVRVPNESNFAPFL